MRIHGYTIKDIQSDNRRIYKSKKKKNIDRIDIRRNVCFTHNENNNIQIENVMPSVSSNLAGTLQALYPPESYRYAYIQHIIYLCVILYIIYIFYIFCTVPCMDIVERRSN